MVVTDTRPGSADDLRLCSWATALAAAVLSRDFFSASGPQLTLPHLLGRGMGRHPSYVHLGDHTGFTSLVRIFLRFLRAHTSLETPPCTRSTPPSWPSLCHPEAVAWPRPLSSPFTHYLPFPHHILVIPPGVLLPSTSPPPLVCLAHVRGDLPLGVAPCVPED